LKQTVSWKGGSSSSSGIFAKNFLMANMRLGEGANFDETEDAKEDYSPGTTVLLDRIEEQWFQ